MYDYYVYIYKVIFYNFFLKLLLKYWYYITFLTSFKEFEFYATSNKSGRLLNSWILNPLVYSTFQNKFYLISHLVWRRCGIDFSYICDTFSRLIHIGRFGALKPLEMSFDQFAWNVCSWTKLGFLWIFFSYMRFWFCFIFHI